MKYVDSGIRGPEQALGTWLANLNPAEIEGLRWQSGYFNVEGLRPLVPLIRSLAGRGLEISCVLGSNNGETVSRDIELLIDLIGPPGPNARIAIVSYSAGLFHPKVYHVSRRDGSQAAYVGSANLTAAGVTGLNVEAGLILDTASGDPQQPLRQIASAVDAWFDEPRSGVERIRERGELAPLVASGVLRAAPVPVAPSPAPETGTGATGRTALRPLAQFAPVPGSGTVPLPSARGAATKSSSAPPPPTGGSSSPPAGAHLLSTHREGYPDYLLFDPRPTAPTQGATALTGTALPSGAAGLIVKLNRDCARQFAGNPGTANLSIPVATMGTLRFGVFQRKYQRPRAEFKLHMRYIYGASEQVSYVGNTNVMAYGFEPGETGHGDIRMLVPTSLARQIREFAAASGLRAPRIDDPMILEWPTPSDPSFRATFVDSSHVLFQDLRDRLESASAADQTVGQGACWLHSGIAPSW